MNSRPPSSLDSHLGYWLRLVSNRISGEFSSKLAAQGVSVAEWAALRLLYDHAAVSPSEMAKAMGMTQGAISKVADKLAAKGWVEINGNAADRRGRFIHLTEAGRVFLPQLAAIADENEEHFFGVLTKEEKSELKRIMECLAKTHHWDEVPTN